MHLPPEYFVFTSIFVLGLVSPGPDFALIVRNSLMYSRSVGRWTAFGIALGILVHVTYCLVGIGLIIEKSIMLFSIMKLAGAAYLIYLGGKALLQRAPSAVSPGTASVKTESEITAGQALRMGFITNALNPKATVLFVSLFSQVVGPNTSLSLKLLYGSEMFFFTLAWFLLLATAFGSIGQTKAVQWLLRYVEKATGALLVAFGLKLAFTKAQ